MAQRNRDAAADDSTRWTKAAGVDAGASAMSLGALAGFIGYALRRAQLSVFDAFQRSLAAFDLRPGDFGVLIVIDSNPGLRSIDVCNVLGFQKTNFVNLLRRLEERGLVRRIDHEDDRRAQVLSLTPAGKRLLDRALKAHSILEQELQTLISPAATPRFIEQLNKLGRYRQP